MTNFMIKNISKVQKYTIAHSLDGWLQTDGKRQAVFSGKETREEGAEWETVEG